MQSSADTAMHCQLPLVVYCKMTYAKAEIKNSFIHCHLSIVITMVYLGEDKSHWTYSVTFAPDIERGIQIF